MAGHNNDGYAGVDVENIAVEKNIVVGMQAPNTFPCMKIDENGRSMPKLGVSDNGGSQVVKGTGYECSCVDTSWLAHCGKYNVSAGNKISFNAGGGGIQLVTTGPIKTISRYTDIVSIYGVNLTTKLFTVTATKRVEFTGSRLDLNFDENYFHGNINFLGNIHVNGGMFVNGEFMCRHITTQGQMNLTDMSDTLHGFIDPNQKFAIMGTTKVKGEGTATATITGITSPHGACRAQNCSVKFSNFSFPVFTFYHPTPTLQFWSKGFKDQTSDLRLPAHQHSFKGPACNFLDSQADVFAQAKGLTESKAPFEPKQTIANGSDSLDQFKEQVSNLIKEHGENWVKEWFSGCSPF